jgi:uncharacterized protein YbjT (DUF2867 family)
MSATTEGIEGTAGAAGTVLVTTATGKTGRRVARKLAALGVPVRAGSRRPEALDGGVRFDWEDPASWAPALRGTASAYIAYHPDLAAPGAPEALREFGRAADEAGVTRLVLLSGRGEPEAAKAEAALAEAGIGLTVVRGSFFNQNFAEGPLAEAIAHGELVFPAGTTPEPFVDLEDLTDVLVEAVTGDGHAGRTYDITGPRLLTFAEAAAEIGAATGREVRYTSVTAAEFAAVLEEGAGFAAADAGWLSELFAMLMDGRNAFVTADARTVLGREPRDFADFVRTELGGAGAGGAAGR